MVGCAAEAATVLDQRSGGATSARARKLATDMINPRFLIAPPKLTANGFVAPIQRPLPAELGST
jgi:hypothetical protein